MSREEEYRYVQVRQSQYIRGAIAALARVILYSVAYVVVILAANIILTAVSSSGADASAISNATGGIGAVTVLASVAYIVAFISEVAGVVNRNKAVKTVEKRYFRDGIPEAMVEPDSETVAEGEDLEEALDEAREELREEEYEDDML